MQFSIVIVAAFAAAVSAIPAHAPVAAASTYTSYVATSTSTVPCSSTTAAAEAAYTQPSAVEATPGPKTFTVEVGGDEIFRYTPAFVRASVGDKIVFKFLQANHTVTESTFDIPCKARTGGFDSGFVPNLNGTDDKTWELEVKTAEPTFAYCRQGPHCALGMVFMINPERTLPGGAAANAGRSTYNNFLAKAIDSRERR